ncbi:hypothetical protein GQ457_01G033570 [Hibiscus cannabinus]
MADRSSAAAKPIWMKQAEETKLKSEAEKVAAGPGIVGGTAKCIAAGPGIVGGTACAASTFMVVTKDAYGRKVQSGCTD